MTDTYDLDLVVLTPGKDDRETLAGILGARSASLGIRQIRYQILDPHPRRDPGCFNEAPQVIQGFQGRAQHALVVFDHEGSGQEARGPDQVAADVESRLRQSGWGDRARALVIVPELETWVWSDSPEVDAILGWRGRTPSLRHWLRDQGLWPDDLPKPQQPKACFVRAVREAGVQLSSSLFRELAERVGLARCQDPSFKALREILSGWFSAGGRT